MFCTKCGTPLSDDAKFCTGCGEKIAQTVNEPVQPVAESQPVVEAQPTVEEAVRPVETTAAPATSTVEWQSKDSITAVAEQPIEAQPAIENAVFAEPVFEEAKPKKKKKALKVLLFTALPLVLVAAIVFLNFNLVAGYAIKIFGSDSDYLKYVEAQAISSYADSFTDYYDLFTENSKKTEYGGTGEMRVVLGDGAKTLLNQYAGDIDLSWLNNTTFKFDINSKDNLMSMIAGIEMNGQSIIAIDYIFDMINMKGYMAFKDFSEKYLGVDLSSVYGGYGVSEDAVSEYTPTMTARDSYFADAQVMAKIMEVLPEGDTLDELIEKYIKIALDEVDDVSSKDKTLKIEDVSQKVTVLELDIDAELLLDMAKACLEKVKVDGDIKDIINNIAVVLADEMDMDAEDAYEEFVDAVDELLDSLEDAEDNASSQNYITLCSYVNGSHEVIGRSIEVAGQEVIYYATVRDGDDFAFELTSSGFEITGKGTEKSDVINGTFEVITNGTVLGQLELVDYNMSESKEGKISGAIRFSPSSDLLNQVLGSDAAMLVALDPAIEIKMNNTEEKGEVSYNILSAGEVLVGLQITATATEEVTDVQIPADENVVDINDSEAYAQWAQSIDVNKIIENLEKAGFPSEILDLLKGTANSSVVL